MRRLATLLVAAVGLCLVAGADPAMAQYSLGTSTTPFTSPGQTITLSYYLGNASGADATVTATLNGQIGSPSCPNPVLVTAGATKTCTFTYTTSLTDVASNAIAVNSQWSFCDTTGCNSTYTDNNVLTVKYQGAPVISGATIAVPYNSPGTGIDLSSHVTGTVLYLSIASPPSHGSAAVNGTVITYTPSAGYYGPDSFSYTATGPNGTSAPAIISETVALPPPPSASATSATVTYNSPGMAIDLTAKITGVATSVTIASAPAHGTVSISGKVVTYTPAAGYSGADSFSYTVTGPGGTSAPATVSLTITLPAAPTVAPATATVPYNPTVGGTGTPIDLTSKISGIATSIAVAGGPAHGTVSINGTVVTYTPVPGYYGPDSFNYTATGPGGTSAPATVGITDSAPQAPAAAPASASVANNSPGTPIDLTSKISGAATSIAIAASPAHGTVSINGMIVTYTPATNYAGADSFTYAATGPGGTSAPALVSVSVAAAIVSGGTITLKVATLGQDGSFTFVSTIPGAASFALATAGGSATKTMAGVPAGTYSIAQASAPAGFQVQSVQCNGVTASGSTASVTLTNGGSANCTFTNTALQAGQQATSQAIRSFMRGRANTLASAGPDPARRHARVTAGDDDDNTDRVTPLAPASKPPISGPGAGGAPLSTGTGRFAQGSVTPLAEPQQSPPMNFSGNVQDGSGQMSFSTSLSQIRQSARDTETARRMQLGGTPYTASNTSAGATRPALFDVWIEAHTTMYADNLGGGNKRGNVDLVYLGADYLVSKSVLVGALVQFDRARETSSVLGTSAEGTGWMAGPYLTARLGKTVLFDARAAWGQSSNLVTTFGTQSDSFATSRALAQAKLSGNWYSGALRFTPGIDVSYFQEQQKAFNSASGAFIPGQTVALGRLSMGPEFGYKISTGDGGVFEPYASLKALWDFKRDTTVSIGGMDVGTNAVRGKAEAGATFTSPSGVAIKGAASYDGLGDKNFHAIEGKLSVHIPLQ